MRGNGALSSRRKWLLMVFLLIVILSYVFASMTVWTTDSRLLTYSRYSRVTCHRDVIAGKSVAPDQFRFGVYYLIEYFFKNIPLKWYDINNQYLSRLLLEEEAWDEEFRRSFDLFFSVEERMSILDAMNENVDKLLSSVFGENQLVKNIVKANIQSLKIEEYAMDPARLLLTIGSHIPEELKNYLIDSSDESRIYYGHVTARFFFSIVFFILLYFFAENFAGPSSSLMAVLLFAGLLPFATQDFLQAETMFSLSLFTGSLIAIVRRSSFVTMISLVLLACTARTDHALFIAVIYSLFQMSNKPNLKKLHTWLKIAVLVMIPLGFTAVLSKVLFPEAQYYLNFFQYDFNLNNIWSLVYPVILLSIPAVFTPFACKIPFYKSTWLWVVPFIFMNFMIGRTSEARLLLPVLVYCLPFVVKGIEDLTHRTEPEIDRGGEA